MNKCNHAYEFDHRYQVYNEPKAVERDAGHMTIPELKESVNAQIASLFSWREVFRCSRCRTIKEVTP